MTEQHRTYKDDVKGRGNLFQRALRRLASSNAELESEELQRHVSEAGAVPISDCTDRQVVDLTGTISTVTIAPRGGHPSLEVELRDGSGAVTLVWLGRRSIPGVDPGRSIKILSGRVSCHEGSKIIYNPRYELLQTPTPR
ncbi:RecG-like helicase [Microlunatus panaciterrae]|uniref:RecG-like helicase n=1 Tax=Microlunatus panaciterrae TaxID=400768 RepID=A0ABS2RQB3_9ACTN|nr:OB-fold nucleic acid binding domain-containing protein [Microlunatus panaciterrae]MBM7800677.1 RecG-like helicase [Microlunatus panaciterrae]